MTQILESEEQFQIQTLMFNFEVVINKSPYRLEIEPIHDNSGAPILIIRSAEREEDTEIVKKIEERLKSLKGKGIGM